MDRRRKIIITLGSFLVFLIILILIIWFLNRGQADLPPTNTNQSADILERIPVSGPPTQSDEPAIVTAQPQLAATLRAVARTFAERFGSYSNQGEFVNLKDLSSLMTVKMKGVADSYVASQQSGQDPSSYYGISTTALSAKVISFDQSINRAEVVVSTQRQEAKGTTINPRTFYQTLSLALVDNGDGWKVDEAQWQ